MIKIRNKRIALLLVLTMLATMFVGVGTASAASNFIQVDSSWTFVEAGESDQIPGNIDIKAKDDWPAGITSVGYVVTLKTEGVNFSDTGNNEVAVLGGIVAGDFPLTLLGDPDLLLDIDDEVTGAITVDVRVYGKIGAAYAFDETETQTIAKVDSGVTAVSVGAKKTVQAGEDGQLGSTITIKEGGPSAFDADEDVTFSILTSGVEWDDFDLIDGPGYLYFDDTNSVPDVTDKKVVLSFNTTTAGSERISLIPYLQVSPKVEDGTEIKIKVSGDEITTTTVVVAVVGSTDIGVKVTDDDKDFVYRGQAATLDDVTVKLNPGGKLSVDWVKPAWFTITLPEGLKWQYDPVETSDWDIAHFEDFEDQGRTIWFDVTDWSPAADGTLKLTNFAVVADANAVVGDLKITFDGCVEGSYKIGSIKNAFTIETVPFALTTGATAINAAKIVITETEDEALKPFGDSDYAFRDYKGVYHEYDSFDIELPAGVSFVGNPEVDVVEGDLEIDWTSDWSEDYRTLYFDIDEVSSQASTIEITGIEYSVLSQPGLGDLKAFVAQDYNIASNKALETLVIGAVATNPTAVYVIGAPTFTVNGAVQSVVTPSYLKNGRTYLAIRDIATGLGIAPVNVIWDAAASKVTLIKGVKIVQVTIGSNMMNINGVAVAMDVAPEISNGRAMLPAAFIAQAFGATASWDAATQTVTIK